MQAALVGLLKYKAAQNNEVLGDINNRFSHNREVWKNHRIYQGKTTLKSLIKKLEARSVDADDVDALVALIKEVKPDSVINAGPPWVNMAIMKRVTNRKYLI